MLQANSSLNRNRDSLGMHRDPDFRPEIQELVQICQEETVFVQPDEAGQQCLQIALAALKGPVIHDKTAEANDAVHCLVGHIGIDSKYRQNSHDLRHEIRERSTGHNPESFYADAAAQMAVPVTEQRPEAEEAQLFRTIWLCQDLMAIIAVSLDECLFP